MKKFIQFINEELFDSVPYEIIEKGVGERTYGGEKYPLSKSIVYRYEFTTDKGYKYNVQIVIYKDERILDIGFAPHGTPEKPVYDSSVMFGNFETKKIFVTIKSLIDKHKDEFDTVITHSEPKKIRIYKKLFKRLGYIVDDTLPYLSAKKPQINEELKLKNFLIPLISATILFSGCETNRHKYSLDDFSKVDIEKKDMYHRYDSIIKITVPDSYDFLKVKNKVILLTMNGCGPCKHLEKLLEDEKIPYIPYYYNYSYGNQINLDNKPETIILRKLCVKAGQIGFPVVILNGNIINQGYFEVNSKNSFESLVDYIKKNNQVN